jgi:methanogenic corrinoid protein MtbC1
MVERIFPLLIAGDRTQARAAVQSYFEAGGSAESLTQDVYWPLHEMITDLYRKDQLTTLSHHCAVRLLRSLVDQAQAKYNQNPRNGRTMMLFCGDTDCDDMAGQIVADLAEADGWNVCFGGGGIAYDELLSTANERQPDVMLMFSSAASDAPAIRQLIDSIRGVGACDGMQIAVGGGIFNRAPGLAEEIGADVWASTPSEIIATLNDNPGQRATAEQRTVGRTRWAAA